MDQVLPDQQVQNWSKTKTIILQKDKGTKEGYKPKEIARKSNLADEIKELKEQHKKNKEGYITSPFGHAEDLWSAAGRIQDFGEAEKFTVMGKDFEIIDIVIVIVVIAIIVIAFWIFMQKKNQKKQEKEEKHDEKQEYENEEGYNVENIEDDDEYEDEYEDEDDSLATESTETVSTNVDDKKQEGGINVVNCGGLDGGAAFDKKIVI